LGALRIAELMIAGVLGLITLPVEAASCSSIREVDLRNLCMAIEREERGYCDPIRDMTLRASCTAELTGDPSFCDPIRDPDQKVLCRARSGRADGR
jgi:hypothetical protein